MRAYLFATVDSANEAGVYAFRVGNYAIQTEKHFGWTAVEASLHGLLALSNFVIKNGIYRPVADFILCTASKQVIRVVNTDRLEQLKQQGWHDPDGPVFYLPILKELYFHHEFYKERGISWFCPKEVSESDLREFEFCQESANTLL